MTKHFWTVVHYGEGPRKAAGAHCVENPVRQQMNARKSQTTVFAGLCLVLVGL